MATPVVFNSVNYSIPAFGDVGYAQGPGNLSSYLIAIASGTLQPTGGLFSLTADANFGPNFGLVSIYYKSASANIATTGVLRLANTDTIAWRNFANTLNLPLAVNTSNQLTFNGAVISLASGTVTSVTGTANQINSTGGLTPVLSLSSTLVIPGTFTIPAVTNQIVLGTTNTVTLTSPAPAASRIYTIPDVLGAADFVMTAGAQTIAGVKTFSSPPNLSSLTASTTLVLDGSKNVASSSVTSTQLGYLLNLFSYRRPVLQFGSVTTVAVEAGLNGTSGDVTVLFSDGKKVTVNSTTQTTFTITRNCALSGTKQSGLRSSLSEAVNTWYALYAVRATDNDDTWVTVGDTVLPLQANYATLNSNYGTGKWCYLGMIRNGDNSGITGDILNFKMAGDETIFRNTATGQNQTETGTRLANTASATTLTYTYAAGTGTAQIPDQITLAIYTCETTSAAGKLIYVANSLGNYYHEVRISTGLCIITVRATAAEGCQIQNTVAENEAQAIMLAGYVDGALGIGSNPLL